MSHVHALSRYSPRCAGDPTTHARRIIPQSDGKHGMPPAVLELPTVDVRKTMGATREGRCDRNTSPYPAGKLPDPGETPKEAEGGRNHSSPESGDKKKHNK